VIVIDEYPAVRVLVGDRPDELGDDEPLALPAYRHYRLLQRVHQPGAGQLSGLLADADLDAIRRSHLRPQLWFGTHRNVGRRLAEIAADLHIAVHVAEPA